MQTSNTIPPCSHPKAGDPARQVGEHCPWLGTSPAQPQLAPPKNGGNKVPPSFWLSRRLSGLRHARGSSSTPPPPREHKRWARAGERHPPAGRGSETRGHQREARAAPRVRGLQRGALSGARGPGAAAVWGAARPLLATLRNDSSASARRARCKGGTGPAPVLGEPRLLHP